MRKYLHLISPRRAVADFAGEWRQPSPHRWKVLGVSIALTFFIFMMFVPESQRVEPRPPTITWITTYAPGRTQAEIIASNLAHQRQQDEIERRLAQREEIRRELYRELGRASGMDVDKMEREIERDRAAERARAGQAPAANATAVPQT